MGFGGVGGGDDRPSIVNVSVYKFAKIIRYRLAGNRWPTFRRHGWLEEKLGQQFALGSLAYAMFAGSDLIPELHTEYRRSRAVVQAAAFGGGIAAILLVGKLFGV